MTDKFFFPTGGNGIVTNQYPGGHQEAHQGPTLAREKATHHREEMAEGLKTLIQKSDGLSQQQQGSFIQKLEEKEGQDGKAQIPYLRNILSKQQQRYDYEDRKLQDRQQFVRDQRRLLTRNFDRLAQTTSTDEESTNRLDTRSGQYLMMKQDLIFQNRKLRKSRKCHLREKRRLEADRELVACFEKLKQEKKRDQRTREEGSATQQSNTVNQTESLN